MFNLIDKTPSTSCRDFPIEQFSYSNSKCLYKLYYESGIVQLMCINSFNPHNNHMSLVFLIVISLFTVGEI